jgi:hypothetical protein
MVRLVIVAFAASLLLLSPAAAKGRGFRAFVQKAKPVTAKQRYVAGFRIPAKLQGLFKKRGVQRPVVHINSTTLPHYVKATQKGYLEVVVPSKTGHVWFRHGEKLYDFAPDGFRVSGVRPINKERYGVLVKLTKSQEKRLVHYLDRLEKTKGAELGLYSFHGNKGFHCVTWLMRQSFGSGKSNLVQMLGGSAKDGSSMPRFTQFMLKRAQPVEAVVVYNKKPLSEAQLSTMNFDVMSSRQLRKAYRESQAEKVWGSAPGR